MFERRRFRLFGRGDERVDGRGLRWRRRFFAAGDVQCDSWETDENHGCDARERVVLRHDLEMLRVR